MLFFFEIKLQLLLPALLISVVSWLKLTATRSSEKEVSVDKATGVTLYC